MASFIWDNSVTDRDGTNQDNWTPQSPVGGPEAGDTVAYAGIETGATPLAGSQLPLSMPAVNLSTVRVTAAYTLSASGAGLPQNLTSFTGQGDATWDVFEIRETTLQTPLGAEILAGGTLQGDDPNSILDSASPVTTAGDCTIDWADLDIFGGLDAGADTITHLNGSGSTLTCDVTGDLDLGTTADTGVAVDIQPAGPGTVTLGATIWPGDITMTSGTLVRSTFDINASGDITYVAGTAAGLVIDATGTTKTINWAVEAGGIGSLTVSGSYTASVGGTLYVFALHVTGSLTGTDTVFIRRPTTNDCFSCSGTISNSVMQIQLRQSISNALDVTGVTSAAFNLLGDNGNHTWTQTGKFEQTGALLITAGDLLEYICLSLNTHSLGAVTLGTAGAVDKSGKLTLLGMGSIASLVSGDAANLANAVDFGGGSHVEFSGLADFDNIAVTASTDMPPEIVCPAGGSVANCDPDNEIALFGDASVDGGGNGVNIAGPPGFINNQSYPGSLLTMGIGGGRLLVPFWLMGMVIYSMMTKGMC